MLTISHGHRRGFLKIGTAAFGGLTLANLLEARAASGGSFLRDRAVVVMNLQGRPTQFEPFDPNMPSRVRFTMPDTYHCFRSGHRIMVQVQSSWFPLVDRNPQKFCDIFRADEDDYRSATQRVFRSPKAVSRLNVMVLP